MIFVGAVGSLERRTSDLQCFFRWKKTQIFRFRLLVGFGSVFVYMMYVLYMIYIWGWFIRLVSILYILINYMNIRKEFEFQGSRRVTKKLWTSRANEFFWSSKIGPPEKRTYAQRYESGLAASEQLLLQRSGECSLTWMIMGIEGYSPNATTTTKKLCKALIRPNLREHFFKQFP